MKKKAVLSLFALVFGILCLTNQPLYPAGDKIAHFGLSTVFGAAGESFFHYFFSMNDAGRISLGTLLGTTPGLIKEFIDSGEPDNRFDFWDLAADFSGALLGALVANMVNKAIAVNAVKSRRGWSFSFSLRMNIRSP